MGPITKSLLQLQKIETELYALRQSQAARSRSVASQERKLQQLQKQVEQKTDQIKHMQAEASNQELDLKSQESEIGKLRNALNTAKSNKEYAAILTEINSDKADSTRLEERILALLAEIDQMRTECTQAREDIQKNQARLQSLQQELEKEQANGKERLATLQADRSGVASTIPPKILRDFDRIVDGYAGQAMAAVVKDGKKHATYSCSECHMGVTIDSVDALMSKDEVRHCPHCQRLLYIEPNGE